MDSARICTRAAPSGQTLIEYALILAAMVFVAATVGLVGYKTNQLLTGANASLQKYVVPAPGTSVSASEGSISLHLSSVHKKDFGEGEDSQ